MKKRTQLKQTCQLLLTFLVLNISCSSNDQTNEDVVSTDTIPPSIAFTSPTNDDLFIEAFEVIIAASDNEGISKVDLFLDNGLVGSDTNFPFEFLINIDSYQSGTYILKGVATDLENNSAESEVSIKIAKPSFEAPLALSGSKGEFGNKIVLTWNSVNNATNYQIFKQDDSNEYQLIGTTSENSYEDTEIQESLTIFNYRVRVYNSELEFGELSAPDYGYTNGDEYDIVVSFGSEGTGNGQFLFNEHVSVDSFDNIYVTDTNGNKIELFNSSGEFIERFLSINSPRGIAFLNDNKVVISKSSQNLISVLDENNNTLNEWGSQGSGNGQFFFFRQIASDSNDNIYVVDHNNHRVQKFDVEGNFLTKWGQNGANEGEFNFPWGIAVSDESVLVSNENMVQIFDLNGNFISKKIFNEVQTIYDLTVKNGKLYMACGNVILKSDLDFEIIQKIKQNEFILATGVAVNSEENLIVSDTSLRTITILKEN